jgi:hypothetical protein
MKRLKGWRDVQVRIGELLGEMTLDTRQHVSEHWIERWNQVINTAPKTDFAEQSFPIAHFQRTFSKPIPIGMTGIGNGSLGVRGLERVLGKRICWTGMICERCER